MKQFRLSKTMVEQLHNLSIQRGLSVANLVQLALRQFLERATVSCREQYNALKAELAQRNRELERAHELLRLAYEELHNSDEMDKPRGALCAAIMDHLVPVDPVTPTDVEWAKQHWDKHKED